jgi:hypothetical protein
LQEAALNGAQQVQRRNAEKRRMTAVLIKEGDWALLRREESEKRKFVPLALQRTALLWTKAAARNSAAS